MDLFGINADHGGGRRRWTAVAWPLLGGLVGALLGVLMAPLLVRALHGVIAPDLPWLLPLLVLLCALGTMGLFIVIGRRGRSP